MAKFYLFWLYKNTFFFGGGGSLVIKQERKKVFFLSFYGTLPYLPTI